MYNLANCTVDISRTAPVDEYGKDDGPTTLVAKDVRMSLYEGNARIWDPVTRTPTVTYQVSAKCDNRQDIQKTDQIFHKQNGKTYVVRAVNRSNVISGFIPDTELVLEVLDGAPIASV